MNSLAISASFCCVQNLCRSRVKYFFTQRVRMGLLTEGNPLSWEETKALAEHVRQHGIEQFINLYKNLQDRTGDVLKWGDEVCVYEILPVLFSCWMILYIGNVLLQHNKKLCIYSYYYQSLCKHLSYCLVHHNI